MEGKTKQRAIGFFGGVTLTLTLIATAILFGVEISINGEPLAAITVVIVAVFFSVLLYAARVSFG